MISKKVLGLLIAILAFAETSSYALAQDKSKASVGPAKASASTSSSVRVAAVAKPIPVAPAKKPQPPAPKIENRGWTYLIEKLVDDGLDRSFVTSIYNNPGMPIFDTVYFKLRPRETSAMYSAFTSPNQIVAARNFLTKYEAPLAAAERAYKVSRYVVVAIMLVETHFGNNVGKNLVLNRLSRIAAINQPGNVRANYFKIKKEDDAVTLDDVIDRANYLHNTFYPEVVALLEMAKKSQLNLMNLKGSSAGAFGIPQFLPSTFAKFATDGNRDGVISLFTDEDAIYSVSNFLASFGWKENDLENNKAIVWKYNHSPAYVDAIFAIAKIVGDYPADIPVQQPTDTPEKKAMPDEN